jgi:hypothetical protein
MTERRPLVEENELFAKLVADARRREPPPEALESLHQKLAARPGLLAELASSGSRRWGWTALAGIACLAVVGVELGRRPATEHISEVPPSPASMTTVTAPPPSPPVDGPAMHTVPSVSIDDLPSSFAARSGSRDVVPPPRARLAPPSAPASSALRPSQPPGPSVRRELELIALARAALTRGDARACLEAIDLHDREFPAGQFALEAKVMRIEAAFAAGDRAGARALARDYLAANPSSPYDARIRSLLSSMEDR